MPLEITGASATVKPIHIGGSAKTTMKNGAISISLTAARRRPYAMQAQRGDVAAAAARPASTSAPSSGIENARSQSPIDGFSDGLDRSCVPKCSSSHTRHGTRLCFCARCAVV